MGIPCPLQEHHNTMQAVPMVMSKALCEVQKNYINFMRSPAPPIRIWAARVAPGPPCGKMNTNMCADPSQKILYSMDKHITV